MKFIENKDAVSPVVGVMLMLVVTLIIAGVVSAFGGGLVSTTSATPQASLSSSLTYGNPMTITHNGGDSLIGSSIDIKTKIVSGANVDMVSDAVLTNSSLARTNASVLEGSFQTGDVLKVPWTESFKEYYPAKGDMVTVTIFDKNSGKQIASSTIPVF
jgi:FlaG/FlaF family flagellin (archaellin)